MSDLPSIAQLQRVITGTPRGRRAGELTRVVGLALECRGLSCSLGDVCHVERDGVPPLLAEVVGFAEDVTWLMPLGESEGLAPRARVFPTGQGLTVACGRFLLGRVVDALGHPMDAGEPFTHGVPMRWSRPAPHPLERPPIDQVMTTGVSVIDGLLTLGRGQRMGIFAGSGVGKSTLLASLARGSSADVNVIALIGERGREVRSFLEETLTPEARSRSVLVVATSDAPPLLRFKAAFTAVAIAEFFRDQGQDVLFFADSVTRLAAATREIGLALGEPPTVKGYPPSFFGTMPRLLERLGRSARGSITGLLTVLVDGDDHDDPVADTLRGLLDGHIVLSRALAGSGHHPAVDVLASVSRVMDRVVTDEHRAAARSAREMLALVAEVKDLVSVGAYRRGSDERVDRALALREGLDQWLRQESRDARTFEETVTRLREVVTTKVAVQGRVAEVGRRGR